MQSGIPTKPRTGPVGSESPIGCLTFKIMLKTLALVLASSTQATFLPADLGDNLWIVEAEVGGKRGKFQIGTNFGKTVISDKFLENKPAKCVLKIGSWQSAPIEVTYTQSLKTRKIDGVLGDNCFKDVSIGFDTVNRRLSVESDSGRLSAWLQSESTKVTWLPLAQNDDDLPLFNCSVAGTDIVAGLTSGLQFSRVDPDIVDSASLTKLSRASTFDLETATDVTRDTGFLSQLSIGTIDLPPTRVDFRSADAGNFVTPMAIVPDALGDRVVLDYKKKRLGFTSLSTEQYATLLWRNIFQWTVQGANSTLIVPERCRFLGPTQFSKAEVLEVGGIKASDLIKSLSAARKFQDIASLAELAETRYPVLFRTTNGLYRMNLKIDREK